MPLSAEYETPPEGAPEEPFLTPEERAHFVQRDLPEILDRLLGDLARRFGIELGVTVEGAGTFVPATRTLPGRCRQLLADPATAPHCLAEHAPAAGLAGWSLCHAGLRFCAAPFAIEGLGPASAFAVEAPPGAGAEPTAAARPAACLPAGELLPLLALMVQEVVEGKLRDLARARAERLAKQLFLHEAALGLASVETTLYGLEDLLSPYLGQLAPADRDDLEQHLQTLKREYRIHRMTMLNLLHYYSPAAYAEVQKSQVHSKNPAELLRELVPLYEPLARARGMRIEARLDNWLSMPRLRMDEAALTRAFHNVIWNAIKYSYRSVAGETDRYVCITCQPIYNPGVRGEGRECAVLVENYGLGIRPDEISKVTRPTFRGAAAIAEKVLGSGLGLYETERIVREHGGRLRITSRETHEGTYLTRVYLILPYRTAVASPAEQHGREGVRGAMEATR